MRRVMADSPHAMESRAILPDDFLLHQFHLDPSLIREKLDAQASALSREREYILERLRLLAPGFVALVESSNT